MNFSNLKNKLKPATKIGLILAVIGGIFATSAAMADAATAGIALSAISKNFGQSTGELAHILSNVSLIAGIGFVMASFFKFHQHKLNPTQVPMSQGITLLLFGAGLTLFPILIPTAKRTIFGATAHVSKISGQGMATLIGATSK